MKEKSILDEIDYWPCVAKKEYPEVNIVVPGSKDDPYAFFSQETKDNVIDFCEGICDVLREEKN